MPKDMVWTVDHSDRQHCRGVERKVEPFQADHAASTSIRSNAALRQPIEDRLRIINVPGGRRWNDLYRAAEYDNAI